MPEILQREAGHCWTEVCDNSALWHKVSLAKSNINFVQSATFWWKGIIHGRPFSHSSRCKVCSCVCVCVRVCAWVDAVPPTSPLPVSLCCPRAWSLLFYRSLCWSLRWCLLCLLVCPISCDTESVFIANKFPPLRNDLLRREKSCFPLTNYCMARCDVTMLNAVSFKLLRAGWRSGDERCTFGCVAGRTSALHSSPIPDW